MTNSKDKKLRLPIILFLVLLLFVAIYVGATAILHQISMAVTINETVSITIEPGSGTAAIAEKLEEAGLIRNQRYFRSYVAKSGIDASLKAGAFIFQAGEWSVEQVAQLLAAGSNGPVDDTKVTIPEGLKVSQIARIFANAGLADYDAFMDYCSNGEFPYAYIPDKDQVPEPGNRLEGFLFPDTYMIDPDWTEQQIVDMLLHQFAMVWEQNNFQARADELGKGVYEIVIMASLVEKEAVVEQDRPLIAGVFYKRLEIGMNLESCATIQFLFDEPKLKLLNSDLKIESPYNCYLHNGLPPAPIAAPGLASLKAAAYPEESEYLFFRARTDGSHRFSKTLAEHESHQPDDQ